MNRLPWRLVPHLPVLLAAVWVAGHAAASDWQPLLGNSPFGGAAEHASASTGAGELEFRGVVQEEDLVLVNLFNPATKTSTWVPVNGSAAGIVVQGYDPEEEQLSVAQAGRQLTLPLKQAKVVLAKAPVAKPAGADEASPDPERLSQFTEEIRRRRALREPGGGFQAEFLGNLPPEARAAIEEIRRARRAAAEQREQDGGAAARQDRPGQAGQRMSRGQAGGEPPRRR